ncbi:MAG: hypothetical protein U0994_03770 [Gemmatimonadales bacterium]|nr:hypothetical protein [Gemmatimonadales bacterium]
MAFLVLRPDDHSPAPLPDGEALALPPGTIFALPASLWAIEEDLETIAALVSRHPWIPAVIIEDGTAAPRGLGSEARYLLAGCCDVRRVVPPPPPHTHRGGDTRATSAAEAGTACGQPGPNTCAWQEGGCNGAGCVHVLCYDDLALCPGLGFDCWLCYY